MTTGHISGGVWGVALMLPYESCLYDGHKSMGGGVQRQGPGAWEQAKHLPSLQGFWGFKS